MIYILLILIILYMILISIELKNIRLALNKTKENKKESITLESILHELKNINSHLYNIAYIERDIKKIKQEIEDLNKYSNDPITLDKLYKSVYNIQYYLGVAYRKEIIDFVKGRNDVE